VSRTAFWRVLTTAVLCLILFACAAANAEVVQDEEGGTWDYGKGIYTDPDGNQYSIYDGDSGSGDDDSSFTGTKQNADGSVTIYTGDTDSVVQNEDGSISVESGTIQIKDNTESKPMTAEEYQAARDKIAERNGRYTQTFYRLSADKIYPVDVVYLGLARSTVVLQGAQQVVNTCDLMWETDAPENKVLAVINTPKVGYAWLRAKPSTNKKVMKMEKCITSSVVRVLDTNKEWTFIDYNGVRGYVKSGSLTFYDNNPRTYQTGTACVNGRVMKGEVVPLRASAKSSSRKLADCAMNTPLTIFSEDGKWIEVDAMGFHGYIESKHVMMDANLLDTTAATLP